MSRRRAIQREAGAPVPKYYHQYQNDQRAIKAEKLAYNDPLTLQFIVRSYTYEHKNGYPMSPTTAFGMQQWLRHFNTFLRSKAMQHSSFRLDPDELDQTLREWKKMTAYDRIRAFEQARDSTHKEGLIICKYFGWEQEALVGIDPKYYEESIDPWGARQEMINEHCHKKVNELFQGFSYAYG
jgi:hypothetical protein